MKNQLIFKTSFELRINVVHGSLGYPIVLLRVFEFEMEHDGMPVLVGRKVPDFTAPAVMGDGEINNQFRLLDALKGKYGLIFFYPLDFTFVCPSELIAVGNRMEEFKKRKVEVIGVSIDSHFTHTAWRNTPVDQGGIGPVPFTLVADIRHTICQAFGIEHPDAGVALRAAFFIDKEGIVRAEVVHDLPLGRNFDELLRIVDGWQFYEKNGEVCPAGWKKGDQGMKATAQGVASYLECNAEKL